MSAATTMTATVVSSGSGIQQYSPIGTLERQYTEPVGRRFFLFIKANANCCLEGGVEGVMKIQSQGGGAGAAVLSQQQQQQPAQAAGEAKATATPDGKDPFSFLNEEPSHPTSTGALVTDAQQAEAEAEAGRKPTSGGGGLGRFVKNVVKTTVETTKSTLVRGMHAVAIRADSGRNPDQFVAALYDESGSLLSCSEPRPFPKEAERYQGLRFEVPLCVPADLDAGRHVTVKLWIRSGSTLLQQTKLALKHYLIGMAHFSVGQLRGGQQQQAEASAPSPRQYLTVTLQSSLVVDGRLSVHVCPDTKFPPLTSRGWSLADPDAAGYAAGHFNLPLDQPYGHGLANHGSTAWMVAVERSIESSVVLPIAAAFAERAAAACRQSLLHAEQVSAACWRHRHDGYAHAPEYVDCAVSIAHFRPAANGDGAGEEGSPFPSLSATPMVLASWQRPDSIFEVELLLPTKLPCKGEPFQSGTSPSFRFYPKPCRAGVLPALLQSSGGKLPPTGFFLGSVRLSVAIPIMRRSSSGGALAGALTEGNPFDAASNSMNGFVEANPFDDPQFNPNAAAPQQQPQNLEEEVWECVVALEPLVLQRQPNLQQSAVPQTMELPVFSQATGRQMGTLAVQISLQWFQQPQQSQQMAIPVQPPPLQGGLVSLTGLDMPVFGLQPALDVDSTAAETPNSAETTCAATVSAPTDPAERQRLLSQLSTMGPFFSAAYMDYHLRTSRRGDLAELQNRATEYRRAVQPQPVPIEDRLQPVNAVRTPRAFRASSSRPTELLAGIAFNVHTASLALDVHDGGQDPAAAAREGDLFYNVTCGAPADHARGFGNVFAASSSSAAAGGDKKGGTTAEADPASTAAAAATTTTEAIGATTTSLSELGLVSPVGPVSGGLRRLEAKRRDLMDSVARQQRQLCQSIGHYIQAARAARRSHNYAGAISHVPARHAELQAKRWKLFEAVQSLHHVTWICAVRRSAVFSQALGVACTSYLAALSDPAKWPSAWPGLWARHGYLMTFEGLLSAAGKELGMIEDASVGIEMLRRVSVSLVSDDGTKPTPADGVPVPYSPYLRWLRLVPSGSGPSVSYAVTIGVLKSYYDQRIPLALKDGVAVRFYPLLFEVGVDIRQWGANTGTNMKNQFMNTAATRDASAAAATASADIAAEPAADVAAPADVTDATAGSDQPSAGLLDDEDDDVGECDDDVLVQLNYEAFQKLNAYAFAMSPANSSISQQRIHPLTEALFRHIRGSAGKMDHEILLEAAALAQQLGGGGAVFCKSGKDRTAMHVTYKQALFAALYKQRNCAVDGFPVSDTTAEDATLMRVYGTRLPICQKNVGQAKYAFNSLQVKFMPETLRPPLHTLAGFLKGGKVFSGGGIES